MTMPKVSGTLGSLSSAKPKTAKPYKPKPKQWLATATNGPALLYIAQIGDQPYWSARRVLAHRFASKATAAKYGFPRSLAIRKRAPRGG